MISSAISDTDKIQITKKAHETLLLIEKLSKLDETWKKYQCVKGVECYKKVV